MTIETADLEKFFHEALTALIGQMPTKGDETGFLIHRIELFEDQKKLWLHLKLEGFNLMEKMTIESRLKSMVHKLPELQNIELLIYYSSGNSGTSRKLRSPDVESPRAFGIKFQKKIIHGIKSIVLVASGKGGVGKSTVSTNLAIALAKRHRVGLLDADIYGPSAQQMLGVSGPLAVSPEGKLLPKEIHGLKAASFAFFMGAQEPVLWRGPMVAKAIKQLLFDVTWGELDFLIVDLPPGTGDVHLAIIEEIVIAGALVVTTGQDVALIDAVKAIEMFRKLEVPLWGLVDNMSYFDCGSCTARHFLYGEQGVAKVSLNYKIPILSHLPFDITLRQNCDNGTPTGLWENSFVGKEFQSLAARIAEKVLVQSYDQT